MRPVHAPWPGWKAWTAVAVGGALGAEARWLLGLLFPQMPGSFDATTFGINLSASAVLGFLTSWWILRPSVPAWLKAGAGPGLLGSFSTFSAVALSLETMAAGGAHGLWLLYGGLTAAGGVVFAAAGLWLGNRAARSRIRQGGSP